MLHALGIMGHLAVKEITGPVTRYEIGPQYEVLLVYCLVGPHRIRLFERTALPLVGDKRESNLEVVLKRLLVIYRRKGGAQAVSLRRHTGDGPDITTEHIQPHRAQRERKISILLRRLFFGSFEHVYRQVGKEPGIAVVSLVEHDARYFAVFGKKRLLRVESDIAFSRINCQRAILAVKLVLEVEYKGERLVESGVDRRDTFAVERISVALGIGGNLFVPVGEIVEQIVKRRPYRSVKLLIIILHTPDVIDNMPYVGIERPGLVLIHIGKERVDEFTRLRVDPRPHRRIHPVSDRCEKECLG